MSQTQRRIKTYKNAKEQLNKLIDNKIHCLLIHYSCESFYDVKDGRSPRITSIAVRYLDTAQTKSFSVHKTAEINSIPFDSISDNYDAKEKDMLTDFYNFVIKHDSFYWLHWNMRDVNFGFEAIKHRAILLGIVPFDIKDEKKFDIARLLIDKYGTNYSGHPRLPSILEMNKMSPKNWLDGKDEAFAFEHKNFVKLHQSTLTKVDVFERILNLTTSETLKTKSNIIDRYGISAQGLFELTKEHWLYSIILILFSAVIGALFTKYIGL